MADAKHEEKEEKAESSFDIKAFSKGVVWVIATLLVVLFSFLITVINPTTALNFVYFLNFLQIFFGFVLLFLIYKWIDYTYKFQHWGDKIGDFYGRYKPDEETESSHDPLEYKYTKAVAHIKSADKEEWKTGVLELDTYLREVLRAKGYSGDSMVELLQSAERNKIKNIEYAENVHILRNLIVKKGIRFDYPKEKVLKILELFNDFRSELLK